MRRRVGADGAIRTGRAPMRTSQDPENGRNLSKSVSCAWARWASCAKAASSTASSRPCAPTPRARAATARSCRPLARWGWAPWRRSRPTSTPLGLESFFTSLRDKRHAEHLADVAYVMTANRLVRAHVVQATDDPRVWFDGDVALPDGVDEPSLDQCYRGLDALARAKATLEPELYTRLIDLTNLDLRLVCCDLTSTYFATDQTQSEKSARASSATAMTSEGTLPGGDRALGHPAR